MRTSKLPVGCSVSLEKPSLQALIDRLKQLGYQVIGPQVSQGAIIYDELDTIKQLPIGLVDIQDGGSYRLAETKQASYFDYVVGPHSLKQYLFPPKEVIQRYVQQESGYVAEEVQSSESAMAIIGARSCDLAAVEVQDRVFLRGPFVDSGYQRRRENLFVVSIQCRRASATCFCHSMKTGPRAVCGFDLALSELEDRFLIEVGTDQGGWVLAGVDGWKTASAVDIHQGQRQSKQLEKDMQQRSQKAGEPRPRHLETHDIHDLLLSNLDHPQWEEVADRCLACGNCTMVCPTCFCSIVEEVSDLTGEHVQRERSWASCFTAEHSYLTGASVRKTTAARYRQWMTHKLATWIDQYGTSGCVGCGRCITWCPVAIDITEEVAAIRETET